MHKTLTAITVVLALAGCGSTTTTAPAEKKEETAPSVDWDKLFPESKKIIDQDAAKKDCAALQQGFDMADQAHDGRIDKGDSDMAEVWTDVMSYIDFQMKKAGCYK